MSDETETAPAPEAYAETLRRGPGRPRQINRVQRPIARQRSAETEANPPPEPRMSQADARVMGRPVPKGLKRVDHRAQNSFYIPYHQIPDGWTYEWKAESIVNQPNLAHMSQLKENHWEPVPQERHPNINVKQSGMVLMERPAYLTEDAYSSQFQVADDAVRKVGLMINQTPEGTFTRNHPSAQRVTGIKREYNMGISVDPNDVGEER